jgi:aldehyde dehydrogenase (NAD+)
MSTPLALHSFVAGAPVQGAATLTIRSPYDGSVSGTVVQVDRSHTEAAIAACQAFRATPTRFQRSEILDRTRLALEARRDEFARIISSEAGLALREARYEVGRTLDVLRFAAMEALRDDGQIFSCDISAQGKPRKIFTTREPLRCAVAITPFNHPLNQVAHKVGPAIAAGTTISEVTTTLGVSKWTARTYLERLRTEGLVRMEGEKRTARWLLNEPGEGDGS